MADAQREVLTAGAVGRSPAQAAPAAGRRGAVAIVAALLVIAALAWVVSGRRMAGMDAGPGSDPGRFGSFLGDWVVMMAAMMLPAIAAPVAHIAAGRLTVLVVAAYLGVWTVVGAAGYAVLRAGRAGGDGFVTWDRAGHAVVVIVLLIAAGYQLTPAKRASLRHCSLGARPARVDSRDLRAAVRAGGQLGAWCVACSWALMASLLALGEMSLPWMVVITALITLERVLPRPAALRIVVAAVLTALAIGVAAAPTHVPGLTVPGHDPSMSDM